MLRRPPRSKRTYTLFPYPTLFRSDLEVAGIYVVLNLRLGVEAEQNAGIYQMLKVAPPGSTVELAIKTRSEEHTSELQSLMRTSYAVFCLKKKKKSKKSKHLLQLIL